MIILIDIDETCEEYKLNPVNRLEKNPTTNGNSNSKNRPELNESARLPSV
jgi:hypothetical protein